MINKRILVCAKCEDTPQQQLRAIILPGDPVPILNPRVQDYNAAETDTRVVVASQSKDPTTGLTVYTYNNRVTSNNNAAGDSRSTQQVGAPRGSRNSQPGTDINAIMPMYNGAKYGINLPVVSVTSDGLGTITATCSAPHGLAANALVAVEGGGSVLMDGFFNVTVVSATVFSYQPPKAVPIPGLSDPALLQANTLFRAAYVGVPLGMTQIPQAGVVS